MWMTNQPYRTLYKVKFINDSLHLKKTTRTQTQGLDTLQTAVLSELHPETRHICYMGLAFFLPEDDRLKKGLRKQHDKFNNLKSGNPGLSSNSFSSFLSQQ